MRSLSNWNAPERADCRNWKSICFIVEAMIWASFFDRAVVLLEFTNSLEIWWELLSIVWDVVIWDEIHILLNWLIINEWKGGEITQVGKSFRLKCFWRDFSYLHCPYSAVLSLSIYMNCWGLCLFRNIMFLRIQTRETITILKRSRILCRNSSVHCAYSSD